MKTEREFQDTPEDWATRLQMEITEAKAAVEKWHRDGDAVLKRFRDERESKANGDTRWNLFWANVTTQQAMLFGKQPSTSVERTFADARDDIARVAGEQLERLLNSGIGCYGDGYVPALRNALDDFLLPGLGQARVRYEVETEDVKAEPAQVDEDGAELAPEVPAHQRKAKESVATEYVHWRDFLWSPARVWEEVRWVAFRIQLPREELVKKFGPLGRKVAIAKPTKTKGKTDDELPHPWGRGEVWEVWHKETRQVFHYAEGVGRVLVPVGVEASEGGGVPDPLELEGFFPCPEPMVANATTSSLLPRPEFVLAQDLYLRIDALSTRITLLEDAVRVVGAYDARTRALGQMLNGSKRNEMVPVENWAMFAEKGGIRGTVDWFPLEEVVKAILQLDQRRMGLIDALYQITGWSDIMRGQASTPGATATEQGIKAKFGSVRVQAKQDRFARFASDLQRLKAEIISRHFDEETIYALSNSDFTMEDQGLLRQAVQMIKSKLGAYRIAVKPENLSLTDFAQLKQEKTEVLTAIGGFLHQMTPLVQAVPTAMPHLLRMLQWAVSGLRGASTIEGVLDQAITAAEQAAQQPQQAQPDPKLQAQAMKGQQDLAKVKAELEADLTRTQAEVAADAQREQNQAIWNVREAAQKAQLTAAARPPPAAPGQRGTKPIGALE